VTTGAQQGNNNLSLNPRWRASAAYVTGGHNLRVGYDGFYSEQTLEGHAAGTQGLLITINRLTGARSFTVTAVNGYPSPAAAVKNYVKATGLYVEDQWTRGRLTLQGALRFDAASSGYPEQVYGPGLLVPNAITFPAGTGVWGYRDLTPRVGVAWCGSAAPERMSASTFSTSQTPRLPWRATTTTTLPTPAPTCSERKSFQGGLRSSACNSTSERALKRETRRGHERRCQMERGLDWG
jgi:hypothetical protein